MKSIFRSGWGRNINVESTVLDINQFDSVLKQKNYAGGITIGLGRSYGDSSLNSLGTSWSTRSLDDILIDRSQKIATCGSGATIGELERAAVHHGLFPKVVPGTEYVTIGGAIASNIHGKSHQKFGSFGDHVTELILMDSKGVMHTLSPENEKKELFWATIGGMGLTGSIISAKISLTEVQTAYVVCEEKRVGSLKELLVTLEEFDSAYQYTVAWIDLSRDFSGRGIVSGANPAKYEDLPPRLQENPLEMPNPKNFPLPDIFSSNFINTFTISAFNSLWFHKPLSQGVQNLRPFLHPLDSVTNWNRIYGKDGFIQYQILVPYGKEDFIFAMLKELKCIEANSFLSVIKRLGNAQSQYLSFSGPGWTIAIDFSAKTTGLTQTLANLDRELSRVGGRVYLTKDSLLERESFEEMYPAHKDWKKIKSQIDPENYWQSEQGKRLGLC